MDDILAISRYIPQTSNNTITSGLLDYVNIPAHCKPTDSESQ